MCCLLRLLFTVLVYFVLDGSDTNASQLLGEVDSAFLFCYAIAMFGSGFIAERVNLRYFLSLGMLLSGVFTYVVGLAKVYNIHNLWYFILMQVSCFCNSFLIFKLFTLKCIFS